MKILVISQYFYPENFRINDLCFDLANKNHDVTVLTGLPNYPLGEIYPGYENKANTVEEINNVKVIRCNIFPRKKNPINLILNYFSFAHYAKKKVKSTNEKYDVVFVFEVSPIFQVIPAKIYKNKFNCPVIINCQDIWPEVIKVYGIKEKSILYKVIRNFSEKLYKVGDIIAVSSPGFQDYLFKTCHIQPNKIKYLPNFAEDFYLSFDNQIALKEKLHLLFAGNIGKAQNLQTLVEAINILPELEKSQIMIDIVGNGSFLEDLRQLINRYKLSDFFTFHGQKNKEELQSYYEEASAYLITLEGDSPVSLTIPSKLQGYMGAGKPVLGAIDGGAKDIIVESDCGRCVVAGDHQGLSQIISDFVNDEHHFFNLGQNGREYFKTNFTLNQYTKNLEEIMEDLL